MISLQHIPFSTVFWLLMLALGLFAILQAIRRYVIPTLQPQQRQEAFRAMILRVEPVAWTVLLLWSIYHLLLTAPGTTVLLLILLSFPAYFWLRDYIPGLFFRYDHDAEPGDLIYYQQTPYTLVDIRPRGIKLRNEKGTTLIIPFRLLGAIKLVKQSRTSALQPYVFELETEAAEDQIIAVLQECPWVPPGQTPTIRLQQSGQYTITTYTLDQQMGQKQETYLKARL